MSVHTLNDGRVIVAFPSGTLPDDPGRTREYFGRGPTARAKAEARNFELGLGRRRSGPLPAIGPTFGELAAAYLKSREGQGSQSTRDSAYYKFARAILPELDHAPVSRITPSKIDAYVAQRAKSVKATTIHRELSDIQAVLNYAVRSRMIPTNPIAGYRKPRRDDAVISPPSVEEVRTILQHAAPHLRRYIMISYYTGLRPGRTELLRLTWDSVDFDRDVIRVTSAAKGGLIYRDVPVADDYFYECLNCWYEQDLPSPGYLIHYNGRPVASVKTAWRQAKDRAGVTRRIRMYDLRHAAITLMLERGADLKSVSEIAGHKSIDITLRIYQHTSYALKKEALNRLPSLTKDY